MKLAQNNNWLLLLDDIALLEVKSTSACRRHLLCRQLPMQFGICSEVVALIDFKGDLANLTGVERRLFDWGQLEHLAHVVTLAEEDLVLCEEAIGVGVLKIAEGDTDRVGVVF